MKTELVVGIGHHESDVNPTQMHTREAYCFMVSTISDKTVYIEVFSPTLSERVTPIDIRSGNEYLKVAMRLDPRGLFLMAHLLDGGKDVRFLQVRDCCDIGSASCAASLRGDEYDMLKEPRHLCVSTYEDLEIFERQN